MDNRAGLDDVGKRKFLALPGLELRPLCRPAHSQSLHVLRYPGSSVSSIHKYCKLQAALQMLKELVK
jgi:hypothetical protein